MVPSPGSPTGRARLVNDAYAACVAEGARRGMSVAVSMLERGQRSSPARDHREDEATTERGDRAAGKLPRNSGARGPEPLREQFAARFRPVVLDRDGERAPVADQM